MNPEHGPRPFKELECSLTVWLVLLFALVRTLPVICVSCLFLCFLCVLWFAVPCRKLYRNSLPIMKVMSASVLLTWASQEEMTGAWCGSDGAIAGRGILS